MIKKILIVIMMISIVAIVMAKGEEQEMKNVKVLMRTNMGDIELELWPEASPITVENFLKYVNDGFYEGVVFHRIIDGFMIQTGGFGEGGIRKPATYKEIQNEADNKLSNEIGTLAMARTNAPHSASSQFFINVKNNAFLDFKDKDQGWGYCVFGKVTKGMDVINMIKIVPTHANPKTRMQDWPIDDIVILKMEVIEENAVDNLEGN